MPEFCGRPKKFGTVSFEQRKTRIPRVGSTARKRTIRENDPKRERLTTKKRRGGGSQREWPETGKGVAHNATRRKSGVSETGKLPEPGRLASGID